MTDMSCRDEILAVVDILIQQRRNGTFTVQEVLNGMRERRSRYAQNTIRSHIAYKMCVDAPVTRSLSFPDFERVARGLYRPARGR